MSEYNQAIDDAVEVINEAREEGEPDLRQVREWVNALKKEKS